MKAMILAAGRGRRMKHLTEEMPKPLLSVRGKSLLASQIDRIVKAGIKEIVINVAYLGNQIIEAIGFGKRWGIKICYSCEPEPLETGGGICRALSFLSETFIVTNADVVTDYDYNKLLDVDLSSDRQAHLVLVDNPPHHLMGDFSLEDDKPSTNLNGKTYTFSGIGLYHKSLFKNYNAGCNVRLPEVWQNSMANHKVTAEVYQGVWADIGTPERLSIYN
ncbi:nucleotidyltransferase family protein [Thiotrichales bacterium 19S9-12]|nr:nucleotidyltransferase family protein [Thiotrichales bacterium 19S9-11]MCF6812056.1 nucleotidyltransferase family protein [Thiotrichales bacterium 19S9-12]